MRRRTAKGTQVVNPVQKAGPMGSFQRTYSISIRWAASWVSAWNSAAAVHGLPSQADATVGYVGFGERLLKGRLERGDAAGAHAARVVNRHDDVGGRLATRAGWTLSQAQRSCSQRSVQHDQNRGGAQANNRGTQLHDDLTENQMFWFCGLGTKMERSQTRVPPLMP